MFKKILVPVDFSPDNSQAIEIALKLADADQGRVILLHVIETLADTTFEAYRGFYGKLEKKAESEMAGLVARCSEAGGRILQKIAYGNRAKFILAYSAENQIDLIVMNSHKIDWQQPTQGWGTISHKVGILSTCPVLLVK